MALVNNWQDSGKITSSAFLTFLAKRCRHWESSEVPPNVPTGSPSKEHPYPSFSGSHPEHLEVVFLRMLPTIVDWQREVALDPNYANPEFIVHNVSMNEEQQDE